MVRPYGAASLWHPRLYMHVEAGSARALLAWGIFIDISEAQLLGCIGRSFVGHMKGPAAEVA